MANEPQKQPEENGTTNQSSTNNTDEVEKRIAELETNWKRALADYDNLKRTTAQEKTEMGKFASAMAAYEFAGIYDNFKKAASHLPEAGNDFEDYKKKVSQWAAGIEFIKKQFGETLKQLGLEEIKTVGERFNPVWHEAVGEETAENNEDGQVVREIEGGYKIGDRVVKAAKVVVSKK